MSFEPRAKRHFTYFYFSENNNVSVCNLASNSNFELANYWMALNNQTYLFELNIFMQSFDFKNPRSSKLNDKSNGSLQVITDSFLMCLFANFRILCVKFLIDNKNRPEILDDFQNLNKLLFKPKKNMNYSFVVSSK